MNERTNDDDDADGKKKPPVPVAGRHLTSRTVAHQDNCTRLNEKRSPVFFVVFLDDDDARLSFISAAMTTRAKK